MHCIKCGRSIPENTVFCTTCAALPVQAAAVQLPSKVGRAARFEAAKPKNPPRKQDLRKTARALAISTAVLSLCLIVVGIFAGVQTKNLQERRESLRIREAGVTLREKEADKRDQRIQELEAQVALVGEELQAALDALEQEQNAVAQLQSILDGLTAPTAP